MGVAARTMAVLAEAAGSMAETRAEEDFEGAKEATLEERVSGAESHLDYGK